MAKYRCKVCGYIHEGDTPPEECPLCGVGEDMFELIDDSPAKIVTQWRCTVCGYVHEGPEPPASCPLCGVGPEKFEPAEERTLDDMPKEEVERLQSLLFNCSYGLYIITSRYDGRLNGMASNSFLQVTDMPLRGSVCINKGTKTAELIRESGVYGVSILGQENHDLVKHFGNQTGHLVDKFKDMEYVIGEETRCPGLPQALAFVELQVEKTVDLGTHWMFIGRVVGGKSMAKGEPMTYAYYRATR